MQRLNRKLKTFVVYAECVIGDGPDVREKVDARDSVEAFSGVITRAERAHGGIYTATLVKSVIRCAA